MSWLAETGGVECQRGVIQMLTKDELQAIEARTNAATPGEWIAPLKDLGEIESFAALDFYFDHSFEAYPPLGECGPVFVASGKENADFIAHARTDVPALVAEVRRLQEVERKAIEQSEYIQASGLTEYEVAMKIAQARQAALEEAARVAIDFGDTAQQIDDRGMSSAFILGCEYAAEKISDRILNIKTGVGLHASQQARAGDAASLRSPRS
jgi:hypothetical protein